MDHYLYDGQTISNKIFDFIYGCAMRDAILQKAFIGEKSWVESFEEPKNILKTYIDKLLNNEFESQKNHDEIFLITAKHIYSFCYGNSDLRDFFAIVIVH